MRHALGDHRNVRRLPTSIQRNHYASLSTARTPLLCLYANSAGRLCPPHLLKDQSTGVVRLCVPIEPQKMLSYPEPITNQQGA